MKALVYSREEHGIPKRLVEREAVRIIERLKASGYEAYIVGGAVRDLLVGRRPKDFDIVTDAIPNVIKKIFWNSRIIGRRFRLVHVFFEDRIYEVCTFRSIKEGTIGNSYGTIEEDVMRRDFSLNALYYDPLSETLVDFVHGFSDIKKRVIKPVIPLQSIFVEDPVRMLRAVKYAAVTGFKLPLLVRLKIRRQARLLDPISPSRLSEELFKILKSGYARAILLSLESYGLLESILPELSRLLKSDKAFSSVFSASMEKLDQAVAERGEKRLGRQMAFLLEPYCDRIVDWSQDGHENYKEALKALRSFVLPVNPPRVELEAAVRAIFRNHGLSLTRKPLAPAERPPEEALEPQEVKKRKRRRRRGKRKPEAGPAEAGA